MNLEYMEIFCNIIIDYSISLQFFKSGERECVCVLCVRTNCNRCYGGSFCLKDKESLFLKGLLWQSTCSFSDFMFFLFSLLQKSLSKLKTWGVQRAVKQKIKWHSEEAEVSHRAWNACSACRRNSPSTLSKNNKGIGKSQMRLNQNHSLAAPQ